MAKGVKTGGRRPGSLNKTTVAVRDALHSVFDGIGGTDAMREWAMNNQTQFYSLYAKMLPTDIEISGKEGAPAVQINIVKSGKPSI